ncbi:MAG: hypothetical protein KBE15_09965 [Budvicia sp.]|nr:hypothetical protein [Budvicia sp.]GKX53425.1 hypothetical protein SOASR029_37340 [Budvicia aquatica]
MRNLFHSCGFAQFFATQSIVWLNNDLTAPVWYLGGATLLSMLALPFFSDVKRLKE